MILVGFSGPMGSGKSECAKLINGKILSFATPLKKCVQDLFDFTDEQMYTFEGKEAIDPRYGVSPRRILQQFGTEFVRKVVPKLWLIKMQQSIDHEKAEGTELILVDDIRFENEAELIRKNGGTIVHVLGRRGKSKTGEHVSEKRIQMCTTDLTLNNGEDGIPTLYRKLNTLMEYLSL